MLATFLLLASLAPTSAATSPFADSPSLTVQICLDREGFSPNMLDGCWGRQSQSALNVYWRTAVAGATGPVPSVEWVRTNLFDHVKDALTWQTVTANDLSALTDIPSDPVQKAALVQMGYRTIKEMFAERGHLSTTALARLNPSVDWSHIRVGTRLRLPYFPSIEEYLAPVTPQEDAARPHADRLEISLTRFEIIAYAKDNTILGIFPCSIAASKSKLPPVDELKVVTLVPHPNYTYTPDHTPAGRKVSRHIFPPGPNNPVGVAWIGLSLPGYGIHGTPEPEHIGRAESHGCFRVANWNAARLYALCRLGTRVLITRRAPAQKAPSAHASNR